MPFNPDYQNAITSVWPTIQSERPIPRDFLPTDLSE
jgi:hypothetical protein